MDIVSFLTRMLRRLSPRVAPGVEKRIRSVPFVERYVESEYGEVLEGLRGALKPYGDELPRYAQIPEGGRKTEEIIGEMEALRAQEASSWKHGFASGAVYHGDKHHVDFLNRVYALTSQTNPLHADLWPSITKFEAEVVAMTADMLGADGSADEIVGTVSSGGTESILLAMKTYRDWAEDTRGITKPEIIVPSTAHAAFDKAAQYFRLRLVSVPVDDQYRADVAATKERINENTIAMVGSAPSFPHGIVDPIEELSELARERGIGFHTDACLGGFVLPWAEKLGYDVPPFDFRLPGVTSMSADTHKYGYAPKGSSVVLYRGRELRHYQYYVTGDWSGGLYVSPTFAGSRPGALSAACWAALVCMGQQGYLEATQRILQAAAVIKRGIEGVPDVHILGDPLWDIAIGSDTLDVYNVAGAMAERGWSLNALQNPPAFHICVTLRHTQPGVPERFVADLEAAVAYVREHPDVGKGMAPVYGMAASMPLRGVVDDLLKRYIDLLYEV